MEEIGISHRPKRKPNGITKADKEARKSDDLIKRDFKADKPLEKCVTDMTEVKCLDAKLYVKKHLKTPVNHILEFVDASYIVTGVHSIPVNSIAEQSINMESYKV